MVTGSLREPNTEILASLKTTETMSDIDMPIAKIPHEVFRTVLSAVPIKKYCLSLAKTPLFIALHSLLTTEEHVYLVKIIQFNITSKIYVYIPGYVQYLSLNIFVIYFTCIIVAEEAD